MRVLTFVRDRTWIAPLLVASAALALYGITLAPGVGPVDSGALTLAAESLGVPHPPGFPLYVLLAHVASLVPVGTIAARVNFLSAVAAAIAVAGVYRFTLLVIARGIPATTAQMFGALTAALLFASLRTTWTYATVAEVYALAICLAIVIWLLMLEPTLRRMQCGALLFGLGVGVHPGILVSTLPAFALVVARTHGWRFFVTRHMVGLTGLALAGASVYAYLPLSATNWPFLNWGNPRTVTRFWEHISGWQYRGEALELTVVSFGNAVQRLRMILTQQLGAGPPIAWLLVAAGALHALRHATLLHGALVVWVGLNLLSTTSMNARWGGERPVELLPIDDLDAYFLPTLVVGSILAGIGAARLVAMPPGGSTRILRILAAGIVGLALLQPAVGNWPLSDRRADVLARNYVEDVLESLEPRAMLFVRDWNLSSPLMYVQHVERRRLDVVAVDINLMERPWYIETLVRRYPGVFLPAQQEISTFLNVAERWYDDPKTIQRDAAYNTALTEAFDGMLVRVVEAYRQTGPVYLTFEVATAVGGKGQTLAETLSSRFQLVPHGLAFRLEPDRVFHDPTSPALWIGSLRNFVQPGEPVTGSRQIAETYRDMLTSRGLYLEAHGRCDRAMTPFQAALTIDSTSTVAEAVRRRCQKGVAPSTSGGSARPNQPG